MQVHPRWEEYSPETKLVVEELYNHLVSHPFFDTTIRHVLGIPENNGDAVHDAEVGQAIMMNDTYWQKVAELVDETLLAMGHCNRQHQKDH